MTPYSRYIGHHGYQWGAAFTSAIHLYGVSADPKGLFARKADHFLNDRFSAIFSNAGNGYSCIWPEGLGLCRYQGLHLRKVDPSKLRVREDILDHRELDKCSPRETWAGDAHQKSAPYPIDGNVAHQRHLADLSEPLVLAITDIVRRWWGATDPKRVRSPVPLYKTSKSNITQVITGLDKFVDPSLPLHVANGEEYGFDTHMWVPYLPKKIRINLRESRFNSGEETCPKQDFALPIGLISHLLQLQAPTTLLASNNIKNVTNPNP